MMKTCLLISLISMALTAQAVDMELIFEQEPSGVKSFLLDRSAIIIREAHRHNIEIYYKDLQEMKCVEEKDTADGGYSPIGACIVSGDQFMLNTTTQWVVSVGRTYGPLGKTMIKFITAAQEQ